MDAGFGRRMGAHRHGDRLYGADGFYDDDGVYDDEGLDCSNLGLRSPASQVQLGGCAYLAEGSPNASVWMVFGDRPAHDLDAVAAARTSGRPHINSFLMEFSCTRDHSCLC